MMRVWSHRPQVLHLGSFFVAYVLGCGFAQSLAIVSGTGISIWPPGGLFMATLVLASRPSWPWWVLAGLGAELFGNVLWFHNQLPPAILIYAGNALAAATGAWLVNPTCRRPVRLDTLQDVLTFIVLGAGVAPVISASVGSATLAWFGIQSQTLAAAWPLWWIGDATGALIVAPLALVVIQNWRGHGQISAARWMEACVLGMILLGVAALSLSGYLPFAYIVMPPLLWAAVRFDIKDAAVTLILLALITAVFTVSGASQFAGDPADQKQKHLMLQLFLVVSALSALIVAAISRQHQQALLALRQSEQRLQQLVDAVPASIWCTAPDGTPTYRNKRHAVATGATLDDVTVAGGYSSPIAAMAHPDDRAAAEEVRARAFETGGSYVVRYRQIRSDGAYRWTESRAEPLRDGSGEILQWYGVSVDVHDLVTAQVALRDRERELSRLIDTVPALIWSTTADGMPSYINKRLKDAIGVTLEDLIAPDTSRSLADVHPDDKRAVQQALNQSIETGNAFAMPYRQRRADGAYRWTEGRAEALRDESGNIVQWYGVCVDIDDLLTAQETSRARERELSHLVDMVPSLLWRLTPEGEPIFFNKRMIDFLGLDVADVDKADTSRLAAAIEAVVHPDDAASLRDALNRSLATGEGFSLNYRLRRADGVYRWMSGRAEPMRDHGGRIVQWYGLCHDIDDQMHAEQALRERERQLQQLIDALPTMIWAATPEGEPSYINKRLTDYVGLTLSDFDVPDIGRLQAAVQSSVHPDDAAAVQQALIHSFGTGEVFLMTYRQRRADGVYRWIQGRADPLYDPGGRIIQWYGVCFDVNDEVTAQQALRDREREFSQLVNMIPSHVWRLTAEGEPTFFNKRMVDFLGLDVADMDKPGMSRLAAFMESAVHPDDAAEFRETVSRCLVMGEGFSIRYRRRRADGVYRWMSSHAEPMRDPAGRIVHWYGLTHDIDDQMHAEEALRRSERELQQLVDALSVHIWSWTPDGRLAYVNKRSLEDLGFPGASLEDCARVAKGLVHPEDAPEVQRISAKCLKTGGAFLMRYRRRWKDGNYRWIEARYEPLRGRDGTIVRWYQVSIDIDDEMRAQEALRERERFLWQLVETLPAMIDCAAPDGEPIYRSQQLREFLGYQIEELDSDSGKSRLNGTLDAGVHPDDVVGLKEQHARSLSSGEPYARRHRLRRFDGAYRWVETRAAPMRNPDGDIVQWNIICLDIDSEVRTEEELRLAQERMARASEAASLAELSASIAHEVNQPLAAVVATSHACRRWLSASPPNIERAAITLERIIRDANSASEVVSRIRALFSQMGKARSPADLAGVIAEVCRLMADELVLKNIRLKTDISPDLPQARIDRVQIQQVLVNLIRNAIDSMDAAADGGRLIWVRSALDGESAIRIEVQDLGAGMKEPERAFEPFFTTKEHGMGMGLAICRSIIEAHEGRLWATSNEPRGTTLAFTLPIQAREAA